MKRAKSIGLALLVVFSLSILIPSTAHASGGDGHQVVNVEHVKVNLNLKPLSAAQLKALRNNLRSHVSSVSPNNVAANSCAAVPNDGNCDGQDPIYQGCGPSAERAARSVFSTQIAGYSEPIGVVDLRFSPDCESNWSHGYSGYTYNIGNNETLYFALVKVKVVRDDGLTEEYDQPTESEGWSNMVYAPVRATKACIYLEYSESLPNGGSGGYLGWYCTNFY